MTDKEKCTPDGQVAAIREYIRKGPRANTWSARMPAYAGTSLECKNKSGMISRQ